MFKQCGPLLTPYGSCLVVRTHYQQWRLPFGTQVMLISGALCWRPWQMQRWRRRSEIRTETQGEKDAQIRLHLLDSILFIYLFFILIIYFYLKKYFFFGTCLYFIPCFLAWIIFIINSFVLLLVLHMNNIAFVYFAGVCDDLPTPPLPGKDRTLLMLPLNKLTVSRRASGLLEAFAQIHTALDNIPPAFWPPQSTQHYTLS